MAQSSFHASVHCYCLVAHFSDVNMLSYNSTPHLNAHLEQLPLCRLCNICEGRTLHRDLPVRATRCQVICMHSAPVSNLINKSPGRVGKQGSSRLRCTTYPLIKYKLGNERDIETKGLRLKLVSKTTSSPQSLI